MRPLFFSLLMAGGALVLGSCGTAHRYEYYDYAGKTVDEKNQDRERDISRRFRGIVPASDRSGRMGR